MTEPMLHGELTGLVLDSFFEVFRELRSGFLEATYRNAMVVALNEKGIAAEREKALDVRFHDVVVGHYRMDLVVEGLVIVECKTAKKIDPAHEAQLLNYLHGTRMPLGYVLNFGRRPTFKRVINHPL
jgi:GxxExxY protein